VAENEEFYRLLPVRFTFPFEVWLLPKVHNSDFENIQKHEAVDLAAMMKNVLRKPT